MAQRTYLQLCQKAVTECGLSVTLATAQNQTGAAGRVCGWVQDAWRELQTEHDDWVWMRSSNIIGVNGGGVSFAPASGAFTAPLGTGAGQVGVAINNFGKWVPDTFRNFVTATGVQTEIHMDMIDYDVWRDSYMYGAMRQVITRPVAIAVGPDQSLCFGPPTNGQYTLTGDYYVAASDISLDDDVPVGLPTRYELLIVYDAMKKYGSFEAAPDVWQRGDMEGSKIRNELEAVRMPQMYMGGALA